MPWSHQTNACSLTDTVANAKRAIKHLPTLDYFVAWAGSMLETKFGSGQSIKRVEDDRLLKGEGLYVANAAEPRAKHVYFVRSPYAHAVIRSCNTHAAKAHDGVCLVLSGADLQQAGVPPMAGAVNFKRANGAALQAPQRHLLATDCVRFVGEAVALVVADTLQQAQDAAELIAFDYQPLEVVASAQQSLSSSARLVANGPDNVCAQAHYGDAQATQQAFAQAAHVTTIEVDHQRLAALTLETRNSLATPRGKRLELRASSQAPTQMRAAVAHHLGLALDDIRVLVGDVGGGFGMKTTPYAEDILTAYCAQRLNTPVKWVATRSDDFLTSSHGRSVHSTVSLALDSNGKILALRVNNMADVGAYPTMAGLAIQLLIGPWVSTSVYDIPLIDISIQALLTNRAPTGAYRGAGRPEAILNIERVLDEAARAHGFDRIALRRANMIAPSQMPYTNAMGQVYDCGHFERMLDQALALARVHDFEARAAASASKGLWRGLGVASFLEWTGGNVLDESVDVRILADGSVEVFAAVLPMGQGIETSLTQLVADVFDVPAHNIRVVMGDTDRGNGFGSAASRSLFTGGSAVSEASQRALDKARQLAATELEAAEQDLVYANAYFQIKGTDIGIGLAQLAQRHVGQRIELQSTTKAAAPTWPNACHICEVEIDPQTGMCEVAAYCSVNDIGRVVNHAIVVGQVDGGAVQGIGQALYEDLVYEPHGAQLVAGSLMDYAIPRADVSAVNFVTHFDESVPCTTNVLGVKGVGELGTIGATPAVLNAVAHAFAGNGHTQATQSLQMPLTPCKLWHAIHGDS